MSLRYTVDFVVACTYLRSNIEGVRFQFRSLVATLHFSKSVLFFLFGSWCCDDGLLGVGVVVPSSRRVLCEYWIVLVSFSVAIVTANLWWHFSFGNVSTERFFLVIVRGGCACVIHRWLSLFF